MAKPITCDGQDITAGVQVLYDLVLSSMDFGSGFLSVEDIVPVAELALTAGFDAEFPVEYLQDLAQHIAATYKPNAEEAHKALAWLQKHGLTPPADSERRADHGE